MAERPLAGQVALVTGASRGVGRQVALGLARQGMCLGLVARSRAALDDTLRACARHGVKAVAVPADVTRPSAVHLAVTTVERDLGPIDLLVNNAGRIDAAERPLWEADPDEWWGVVETNLRGPFLFCRAVLPGMIRRGRGRVVNVNSTLGIRPDPGHSAYSVSKSALMHMSGCLAGPLLEHGVYVFEVSPGLVEAPTTRSLPVPAGDPDRQPVERFVDAVVAIARGELDSLTGRFVHAVHDDLDQLRDQAEHLRRLDARTLRLRPYGEQDPPA